MIGRLSDALETGYRIGRARRQPTLEEAARFSSQMLRASFLRGLRRGRRASVELEQRTMWPGNSHDGVAERNGTPGARGPRREDRAARRALIGYCYKCGNDVETDYCDRCGIYVQPSPHDGKLTQGDQT